MTCKTNFLVKSMYSKFNFNLLLFMPKLLYYNSSPYSIQSLQDQVTKDWEPNFVLWWCFVLHVCLCFSSDCLCHFTALSWVHGHSRSLGSLLLIQPASACSPTQFAIKTKFRALKPEGRWVSAQETCCLATGGDRGGRVYLSCRGRCGEVCVCVCWYWLFFGVCWLWTFIDNLASGNSLIQLPAVDIFP